MKKNILIFSISAVAVMAAQIATADTEYRISCPNAAGLQSATFTGSIQKDSTSSVVDSYVYNGLMISNQANSLPTSSDSVNFPIKAVQNQNIYGNNVGISVPKNSPAPTASVFQGVVKNLTGAGTALPYTDSFPAPYNFAMVCANYNGQDSNSKETGILRVMYYLQIPDGYLCGYSNGNYTSCYQLSQSAKVKK